jgi:hypothetical protein
MALRSFFGPWSLLQFRNLFFTQTVGLLERVISPSQGRYLHTGQHKHRLEPTIPAFERAKTVHALDRAATVFDQAQGELYLITITSYSLLKDNRLFGEIYRLHLQS